MPSNPLPMKTAPRDGGTILLFGDKRPYGADWSVRTGRWTASGWDVDGVERWNPIEEISGWLPLPGDYLPMSTAPRDGTRIQVLVKGVEKTRWEYVSMRWFGGDPNWWEWWMEGSFQEDRDEANWLGWRHEPSTEV